MFDFRRITLFVCDTASQSTNYYMFQQFVGGHGPLGPSG